MEGAKLKTKLIIWKDKVEKCVHNIEGSGQGGGEKCERKSREPRNPRPR